jgi:hypothetical protein
MMNKIRVMVVSKHVNVEKQILKQNRCESSGTLNISQITDVNSNRCEKQ